MIGETWESWETRFSVDLDEVLESGTFQWGDVTNGIGFVSSCSEYHRCAAKLLRIPLHD